MDLEFDVVELGPTDHPGAGETVPEFTRPLVSAEYWEDTALSSLYEDGPLLLVFHSMIGAFPATYIWQELQEREIPDQIDSVGLSIATPYAHAEFIRERNLDEQGVRFFADPANTVAAEYNIEMDLDGMTGISEPRPATFVIDMDGNITYAWVGETVPAFPDYDALEAAVETVTQTDD